MATLYQNPSLQKQGDSYSTYQELDTSVPPRAKPVTRQISVNGVVISETELLGEAQNHPGRKPRRGARRSGKGTGGARIAVAGSAAARPVGKTPKTMRRAGPKPNGMPPSGR